MSLSPGQSLLHYEILTPLGEGAMGEVWRAKDTRLGREVAVKVLPPRFAEDEERLRRFEREARSIATLNHPCVAQIHSVDQVEDLCFLVLELVPGETLSDRLERSPMPVEEALRIGARIADGLEAAHDAGIIHRDLKPANICLTPDGKVKLLDFGLARPAHGEDPDASDTDSVLTTEAGRLLGTPTYMAPEQARGQPIDRRVDVWAFGCVLYECLTGRRAFAGESLSDVLAAVLDREPDWSALPPLPPRVEELLRRCLIKDPRQRLRDVGEARLLLDDPDGLGAASGFGEARAAPSGSGRARAWQAVAAVLLAITLILAAGWGANEAPLLPGPLHMSVEPTADTRILFSGDFAGPPVVSPDGTALAFAAVSAAETRRLWVRNLGEPDPRELVGTDGARFPFWSPDSREIGYFTTSHLCRYDLDSGTVSQVVEVGAARGGAFTEDGRIVYTTTFRSGLSIVDAGGGEPTPLTTLDAEMHTSHRWPSMIAGTNRFVFSAVTSAVGEKHNNGIYLGTLDSDEAPRRILPSDFSVQVVEGWLLHVKDDSLLAVEFDPETGLTTDRPKVLAKGLAPDLSTWHGQFSASPAGVLAFHRPRRAAADANSVSYSWSVNGDRVSSWTYDGRELSTYAPDMPMYTTALSPDGLTLAMAALSSDGYTDIWLCPTRFGLELNGNEHDQQLASPLPPRRLTFLSGPEVRPVWSPDSAELAFRWDGDDDHPRGIYRKLVDGGSETLVRDNGNGDDHPTDWTADGRHLVITTGTLLPSDQNDIVAVPLDGGPEIPLVTEPGAQYGGHVSPDGRWLAYVDSHADGVFVIPFAPAWPEGRREGRWLVSEDRAWVPRWSRAGDELYFMTEAGTLIAVDVDTTGESFAFSRRRALFETPWRLGRTYDPAPVHPTDPDGFGRFWILDSDGVPDGPISILLGWQALLSDE